MRWICQVSVCYQRAGPDLRGVRREPMWGVTLHRCANSIMAFARQARGHSHYINTNALVVAHQSVTHRFYTRPDSGCNRSSASIGRCSESIAGKTWADFAPQC